ncbi:unnamed protein product [Rotaria sordida]|uniref:Uncharacterized protein n=1 Tax=Rotaria sordida TaxID=392033 RepID=A0A819EHP1_9BILA|nr:unnamed protein product [Rotaria sordida]
MSQEALDTPSNHDDEKPNHMIIWLDSSIGNPNEYLHLKKAFASNTDPRHENWTMLTDKDYDNLLIATEAQEAISVFIVKSINNCIRTGFIDHKSIEDIQSIQKKKF